MNAATSDNLIGESAAFLEVLEQVSALASLKKPVLIVGERGTGKEAIAARLHFLSKRWDKPYIKLNCAAVNENLLESELFGHEAGSFTGASKKHLGRFERANEGTLFLDELGNSSLAIQEKLLRVIEYGELERVGGSRPVKIDVRVIAATNSDLMALSKEQRFRADLLDRLAFDVITLPPLRARENDILVLANHFAISMTRELDRDYFAGFSENAETELMQYTWPGNVRELKNVIERNVFKAAPDELVDEITFDPFDSPFRIFSAASDISYKNSAANPKENMLSTVDDSHEAHSVRELSPVNNDFPLDLKDTVQQYEIELIQSAMKLARFNQKKCAEVLGLTYHQLRGYLKKYQLLDRQK